MPVNPLRVSETASTNGPDDPRFATRVRNAVAWRWGSQAASQAITWGSTLIVVRLLSPADYGLFAMTQAVVTGLAFLNGQSFATSLIQEREVDSRKIGQVFAMLLLLNGFLAAVQVLAAPWVASYYGEPAVADILRVQAVLFLCVPFSALPSELLARRIEFRSQGLITLACSTIGGVTALLLAWLGYGVWALVWAPIAIFVTRAMGLSWAAKVLAWPVFNFRGAGRLFAFGGALTLCQFFWIIQSQSDIVIAGRVFDTHDLGLYSEALFLTLIFTGRFLPPVNDVAFPSYAELYKQGRSLAPAFKRTLRTVLLVTAPLYIGLSLVADAAVVTVFGPKWTEMAPIVAGLAVAMPFMALQIVCSPATNAMGRPQVYVLTNAGGALIFPLLFAWGVATGPIGLVHAWWVAAPALMVWTLGRTLPIVGLRVRELAAELAPVLVACAVMALAVGAVKATFTPLPPLGELALLVPIGALFYGATLWLFWPRVLRETWAMVRQREVTATPPVDPAHTVTESPAL